MANGMANPLEGGRTTQTRIDPGMARLTTTISPTGDTHLYIVTRSNRNQQGSTGIALTGIDTTLIDIAGTHHAIVLHGTGTLIKNIAFTKG